MFSFVKDPEVTRRQVSVDNVAIVLFMNFRYMEREHGVKKAEAERQLHYAVLDNLIHSYTGVGFKGSKTGIEYEGFRIPDSEDIDKVSFKFYNYRVEES